MILTGTVARPPGTEPGLQSTAVKGTPGDETLSARNPSGLQLSSGAWLSAVGTGGDRDESDGYRDHGSSDVSSYFGSVYGTWFTSRAYAEAVASAGWNDVDAKRHVRVGPTNRRTDADYDTTTWSAFTELGLRMPIRQTSVLEPFGSLSFAYLREESFTESGAGAMDQHISSRSSNSLRSELGMRLQSQAASRSGLWVGELSAAWSHDYDIDDRTIHAGYVGAGGPSFALDGRDVSKDGTRLGADLTLHSRRGYKAALSVGSEIRQHLTSYMARLEITLPF